jgi:hypothetical protein
VVVTRRKRKSGLAAAAVRAGALKIATMTTTVVRHAAAAGLVTMVTMETSARHVGHVVTATKTRTSRGSPPGAHPATTKTRMSRGSRHARPLAVNAWTMMTRESADRAASAD